jgi:hypothetical protein
VLVAGVVEGVAGVQGDVAVDVEVGDLTVVADDLGEEGGVVASAGADLQDVMAGLNRPVSGRDSIP